jgi:hypothetical protein
MCWDFTIHAQKIDENEKKTNLCGEADEIMRIEL